TRSGAPRAVKSSLVMTGVMGISPSGSERLDGRAVRRAAAVRRKKCGSARGDRDPLDGFGPFGALQVHMQQAVLQRRAGDLEPVGKDVTAHEPARRDAPVQIGVVGLARVLALSGDGQLA